MGRIKAVVFDLDGTIVDTEAAEYEAWCGVYREHGCELPLEGWVRGIGTQGGFDPWSELETLYGQEVDKEALRPRLKERLAALVAAQGVRPGVQEYLADAQRLGLRVGLASSSSRQWVQEQLERLGLRAAFDCVRCREDVARVKPDPALYLAAVACLGATPGEAIAIEDSPHGAAAAVEAGLFCVVAPHGLTERLPFGHVDLRVGSLLEAPLADVLALAARR